MYYTITILKEPPQHSIGNHLGPSIMRGLGWFCGVSFRATSALAVQAPEPLKDLRV